MHPAISRLAEAEGHRQLHNWRQGWLSEGAEVKVLTRFVMQGWHRMCLYAKRAKKCPHEGRSFQEATFTVTALPLC